MDEQRAIQWSRLTNRWECVECSGISLSRDYDTMKHATNDSRVDRLRVIYQTASGEAKNRFAKPNTLYHCSGCKFMKTQATI